MELRAGDVIGGRYRLERPIGAGGMGTVWAAQHLFEPTRCAVKVARIDRSEAARSERTRARLLREAKIVGSLMHPHIVSLLDIGEVSPGGALYFAMELLEGEPLAERLAREGRLDPLAARRVAIELTSALAAAHEVGIVHGDVKPSNVYLARGPSGSCVKLLDFGISRVHCEGEQVAASSALRGTPAYMSPELALGETDIDPRSDLWSVGVILYEMLSGRRPFDAPNYPALLARIAEETHPPLEGVEPELAKIVDRCLRKRRDERVPTATALGEWLSTPSRALPSALPPAPSAPPAPAHRGRWLVAAAATATLGLGALVLRTPTGGSGPAEIAPLETALVTRSDPPIAAGDGDHAPSRAEVDTAPDAGADDGAIAKSPAAETPADQTPAAEPRPPAQSPAPKPAAPAAPAVTRVDHPGF